MGKLDNKVAVITGGNSGIGLATAQAFRDEGARVVILGRNQDTLDEALAELGEGVIGVQGDVTNLDDLERLFETTRAEFGNIDILFANAGIAPLTPFLNTTEDSFDEVIGINVKGTYFTVQKAIPYMNDNSSIILTTSVVNELGRPNFSVYAASKAAVRSFARSLSRDLLERGIRVNAVSPGPTETPIFGRMGLPAEQEAQMGTVMAQYVPVQRLAQPEEIANTVVFLASPESAYLVGVEIPVDGGMTQL